VTTANTEKSKAQGSSQPNQNEEYQLKVSKAIATKSARIQVLEDEIRSLENDLYDEENKRYSRRYYSDGRWSYRAGGVSRAPIVREKLDEKRGELSILKQQVATLEVELESMR
jgi:polyhydroxyalkanoate synthesis regulator phasin